MANDRYVLLDGSGAVVNIIEYDDALNGTDAAYQPPEGLTMVRESDHVVAPVPKTQEELKAYAARKRYALEVGGITSPTFGPLSTDRETRAILGQAIQSLDIGLATAPIRFKTPNGFVSLDRAASVAISGEIVAHVQSTFNIEDTVDSAINNGTITTFAEIDAHF